MIMSEELLHCVYLNCPLQDTGVLQGFVCVSSFWSFPCCVLDNPLRSGGVLEENSCITTVPEWREGGHERGGGPSPCSLVVQEDEREAERKTHVRERVEDMSVWDRHIPYKFYITCM